MTEKYFVINAIGGDCSVTEFTKEDLLKAIKAEDGCLCRFVSEPPMSEIPNGFWYASDSGGQLIIKGEIVVPKPIAVVTEYDVT